MLWTTFRLALLLSCALASPVFAADEVYKAGQLNQTQNVKSVEIKVIKPVKIEVDNTQGKQAAQVGDNVLGGLLSGAASSRFLKSPVGNVASGVAGSSSALVSNTTLIDGVQLVYAEDNNLKSAVQVAKVCEFKLGAAIAMLSVDGTQTQIQPNNDAPCQK